MFFNEQNNMGFIEPLYSEARSLKCHTRTVLNMRCL